MKSTYSEENTKAKATLLKEFRRFVYRKFLSLLWISPVLFVFSFSNSLRIEFSLYFLSSFSLSFSLLLGSTSHHLIWSTETSPNDWYTYPSTSRPTGVPHTFLSFIFWQFFLNFYILSSFIDIPSHHIFLYLVHYSHPILDFFFLNFNNCCRYNGKTFPVFVNGRTGAIYADR